MSHSNSDIINWIKKAIGNENCSVGIEGKVGKGNGFMSDIICATVDFNDNQKPLNIIAKVTKVSKETERCMAEVCKREVAFFSKIFPIFKQFQEEKNIAEPFNSVPKCYKAFLTEHTEVIVQENLMSRGYELHESSVAMNMNHVKLVLKNYAKFHAISFALRDQRKEVFKKIEEVCYNHLSDTYSMFEPMYAKAELRLIQNLNELGRTDLTEKYEKIVTKGSFNRLIAILKELHEYRVLAHADCHNGNYLFSYESSDKENPVNVVFLDFQLSAMLSPMIDLGLYLYFGASKEEFSHFTDLMEFYHKELSSFLFELGSDVNILYPISVMWEDWKKYSFFGFLIAAFFLEVLFVDKEEAPEGITSPNDDFLNINLKDNKDYLERLTDIVEHYFNTMAL